MPPCHRFLDSHRFVQDVDPTRPAEFVKPDADGQEKVFFGKQTRASFLQIRFPLYLQLRTELIDGCCLPSREAFGSA